MGHREYASVASVYLISTGNFQMGAKAMTKGHEGNWLYCPMKYQACTPIVSNFLNIVYKKSTMGAM